MILGKSNGLSILAFSVFKRQQSTSLVDGLPVVFALPYKQKLAGVNMQTALRCQRCRAAGPVLLCQGRAGLGEIRSSHLFPAHLCSCCMYTI